LEIKILIETNINWYQRDHCWLAKVIVKVGYLTQKGQFIPQQGEENCSVGFGWIYSM